MSKLRNAFKDGRIVGGVVAVALAAVLGVGVVNVATAQQPAAVVETTAPALNTDLTAIGYTNGLASEQEATAAALVAEQARIAAEAAEAARVAAEAEAARIAAEQAAQAEPQEAEETYNEPAPTEDVPAEDWCPDGYIDDPNLGCHSPICAVLEDGTQVPCQ